MENPINRRRALLKGLISSKSEKEEINGQLGNGLPNCSQPSKFKLNIPNLLENLFSYYQEIFSQNWNLMENTWYQNHRSISTNFRKTSVELNKSDRITHAQNIIVKTEHSSHLAKPPTQPPACNYPLKHSKFVFPSKNSLR